MRWMFFRKGEAGRGNKGDIRERDKNLREGHGRRGDLETSEYKWRKTEKGKVSGGKGRRMGGNGRVRVIDR